jgi:hypothetical protein
VARAFTRHERIEHSVQQSGPTVIWMFSHPSNRIATLARSYFVLNRPWTVCLYNDEYEFYALPCIDIATGYPDTVQIQNKTAMHTGLHFENLWFSRYPWPLRCIHNQGNKFTGEVFKRMFWPAGIHNVQITVWNPQANAMCECMHQMVAKTLRIITNANPPQSIGNIAELVESTVATSLYAIRSTVQSTLCWNYELAALTSVLLNNRLSQRAF